MTRTDISAHAPDVHGIALRDSGRRPIPVSWWMAAAFLISLALAASALAVFGAGERGTAIALRVTARWMFVLFWPAYAGGALAKLGGPRFAALARRGREFGLAFAAAVAVHVGLVLWLVDIAADRAGQMLFFWAGTACTYLLVLLSLPHLREALGQLLWRLVCTAALEYIALVFAVDFIVEPFQDFAHYPPGYLPFALALVGGTLLRFAALVQSRFATIKIGASAQPR